MLANLLSLSNDCDTQDTQENYVNDSKSIHFICCFNNQTVFIHLFVHLMTTLPLFSDILHCIIRCYYAILYKRMRGKQHIKIYNTSTYNISTALNFICQKRQQLQYWSILCCTVQVFMMVSACITFGTRCHLILYRSIITRK